MIGNNSLHLMHLMQPNNLEPKKTLNVAPSGEWESVGTVVFLGLFMAQWATLPHSRCPSP